MRDEFGERRERRAGMADQDFRHFGDDRNRDKVFLGVVGQRGLQRRVDRMVGGGQQQRVAVGRGLRHGVGRDDAAGAGLVLDDERPAEIVGHFRRDHAGDNVHRPARRKRQDQADRLFGILGVAMTMACQHKADRGNQHAYHPDHGMIPLNFPRHSSRMVPGNCSHPTAC
jgi:hypothetical protein